MPKRSTVLTCTICTLGLSGGIGGLVYELQKSEENNYPEVEQLAKQASNLKQKIEELYKNLNNKAENKKNDEISKLIGLFFQLINLQIEKNKTTDKNKIVSLNEKEKELNDSILKLKTFDDKEEEEIKNIILLKENLIQKKKLSLQKLKN